MFFVLSVPRWKSRGRRAGHRWLRGTIRPGARPEGHPFSGDVRGGGRGFHRVLPNEIDGVLGRHGMAVEIALPLLATFLVQRNRLRRFLDPFGGDGQSESAAKSEERTHQRIGVGLMLHAVDETAVDLDLVDLEVAQMIKAGIPGTKIVQRNAYAGAAQRRQRLLRTFEVVHDGRFGQLDLETARGGAGLREDGEDPPPERALLEL